MAKTIFGPGVVVTSKWLNGAREIHFDGQDLDWHFSPINVKDIQRGGPDGLDSVYVTLDTDQTYLSRPVLGNKSFMGLIAFGDERFSYPENAPKGWSTNAKFSIGGSDQAFGVRFSNLDPEDLITKKVLVDQIDNFPIIDEGFF